MKKNFDVKFILRVAGVLFVICSVTALLLATVNEFTAERIAANASQRMEDSISKIFGENIEISTVEGEYDSPVNTVYLVKSNGVPKGYAVYTIPTGFKGDIEMMVGVTLAGNCHKVEFISMSETPGLGTKVQNEEFLAQYNNAFGDLVIKENIQPVAGATISSSAVNEGINAALEAVGGIIG